MTDISASRSAAVTPGALPPPPQPLYWRFLRLHYVRPNGWQRALLVEGVFGAAAILALADAATAWTVLALPLASAAVVKANDVVAGMLPGERVREPLDLPQLADYLPFVAGVGVLLFLRLVVHGTAEGAVVALAYGINTGASLLVYRYTVRRGLPARVCVRYAVISFAFGWLVGLLTGMIDIRRRREA